MNARGGALKHFPTQPSLHLVSLVCASAALRWCAGGWGGGGGGGAPFRRASDHVHSAGDARMGGMKSASFCSLCSQTVNKRV